MRKYLIDLEPSRFEDIIAMNALYRPGPLSYIPDFIKRKHGVEKISYDLAEMEEYLADTYGITVYQEQVMLLSQKIAGFTKGEADTLRKAMGKKQVDVLAKMKSKFIEGAKANGHPEKVLEKIWKDWEAFAHYAFNKSHSTCYGYIAFQTAFLKAHYMPEFMAANLTHNINKIEEISKLIEDCRKNSIEVLGPDVLESELKFTVNQKGQIRFGLAAIKGVGEAAVEDIIRERTENGPFSGVLDFMTRINLRSCNKRCIEALAKAGAFDCFPEIHRAQFFFEENGNSFLEKLIRYATNISNKADSAQVSLFDMDESESDVPDIEFPSCPEWNAITKLKFEQEVTGFYISGHPLDEYKFALKFFARGNVGELKDALAQRKLKEMKFGGIISSATHAVSAKGSPWGRFVVEDFTGSHEFTLFGDQYLDAQKYMNEGMFVFIHLSIVPPPKWKLEKDSNAELETKINKISLLSDVLQNTCKQIEIEIYTSIITETFLINFEQALSKHQGDQSLIIYIRDRETGYKIKTKSNKYKVNCVTLVEELEKMGIDFELK